jgi:hypothetical protein
VYFGSRDQNFYAADATSGKILWKFRIGDILADGSLVSKGIVYFGGCDNSFYAANAKTGQLKWKLPTGGIIQSIACAWNDVLYFGCFDCNLYAVSTSGRVIWKFRTRLSHQSPIDVQESVQTQSVELVWQQETTAKERPKEKKVEISGYGEIKSDYASASMGDYLGKKKRGYLLPVQYYLIRWCPLFFGPRCGWKTDGRRPEERRRLLSLSG